jgi:long-chain acyl-CoA synthetase
VQTAPDAVGLIDATSGERITRAELHARAVAWCDAHREQVAGKTIVLAETNGAEWLCVLLGAVKAGAVVAPLDPGEPLAAQQAAAAAIRAEWFWSAGHLHAVAARGRTLDDGRRLVKLTSGSTGMPRALAFTDAQMIADGRQVCSSMGITPADVNLGLVPFGHSYGLGNLVLPLLLQGTAIASGVAAMPHAIADAVARFRPTVFPAVPALLRALTLADVPRETLASLRTVISAGAPLEPGVAQAFHAKFGLKIHSFYGSSETGGITFDRTGDASLTGRSVGTTLDGVRLEFGRGGRFIVESAAVYTIGNRQRDVRSLGRHRPADIAELSAAGELVLRGRAGRFVKIAGRRLNLGEVERALKRVPGVRDALVAPHPERADALAAVMATERSAEEVRVALREWLASWKIPKKIIVLPEFPLTARGKTDTKRLRELLKAK